MSDADDDDVDPQVYFDDDDYDDDDDDNVSNDARTVPADNGARGGQVPLELLSAPMGGPGARVMHSPEEAAFSAAEQDAELRLHGADEVADLAAASVGNIATLNVDLRGEYKRPDVAAAKKYRARHHPRDGRGNSLRVWGTNFGSFGACSCCCCPRAHLGLIRFGVAVSSYFKLLKLMWWMWMVLLLLQLPVLLTNARSGTYLSGSSSPAVTTIGNLYRDPPDNLTLAVDVREVYDLDLPIFCSGDSCQLERSDLVNLYGVLDAVTTLVYLIFVCCAGRHVRAESRRSRKRTLKVEHYSVMVTVPSTCTAQELRDHFEQLVRGPVHDVQLVHATGDAISLCVRRGFLIKTLARADARRKLLESSGASGSRVGRAERRYQALYERVRALDERASVTAEEGASLFAFVTFQTQADRRKCLRLYRAWTCSPFQSSVLRLHGENPLRVSEAPPPSTLLWENNEVSRASRFARSAVTTLLLLGLLMCTIAVSTLTEPYKLSKSFADAVTGAGTYDSVCGGEFAGALTFEDAAAIAQDPVVADGFALPGRAGLTLLDCLCEAALATTDLAFPNGTGTPGGVFAGDGLCGPFLAARAKDLSIQAAVSFATLLVNTAIFVVLTSTGAFMRYTSIVQRETTILRRVFVVTYVNTGLLVVLNNADFGRLFQVRLSGAGAALLGGGSFVDFTQEWFRVVGVEVLLVAALNVVAPHVFPLVLAFVNGLYRRFVTPVSQTQLNELWLGPDFVLSYRYSQLAMSCFFLQTWSTGLPLLYAFGALSAPVTYWVDKFQFCRVTRTPAELSGRMPEWVCSVLQWAAPVHLAVGMWTLSSPFLFPRDAGDLTLGGLAAQAGLGGGGNATDALLTSGEGFFAEAAVRLFVPQALPNFLLLLLFVLWKLLRNVRIVVRVAELLLRMLGVGLTWCFRGNPLAGLLQDADAGKGRDAQLTFENALDAGAISGISSYFILHNPRYARAFQFHGDASEAKETTLVGVLRQRAIDDSGLSSAFTVSGSKSYSS